MNTIAYFEIQSDDVDAAARFYKAVFGWEFVKDSHMPIPYYRLQGGDMRGALLKRPAPLPTPPSGTNAFVCSIEVAHFDEVAKVILAHGGQVALPKFAVPGKCWQGYFLDPDGNVFGIFQVDVAAA